MMVDEAQMIHATAHTGKVVIEPLEEVARRSTLLQRRRL
jgi:hypothetical protein